MSDAVKKEKPAKVQCQNCGRVMLESTAKPAEDVWVRNSLGDPFSDLECPSCGMLCQPYKPPAERRYASIGWRVGDLQSLGVGLSDKKAVEFFERNSKHIVEAMVAAGHEAILTCMAMDGIKHKGA